MAYVRPTAVVDISADVTPPSPPPSPLLPTSFEKNNSTESPLMRQRHFCLSLHQTATDESAPMRPSSGVSRRLFDESTSTTSVVDDGERRRIETQADLRCMQARNDSIAAARWNFDFKNGVPLPGPISWECVCPAAGPQRLRERTAEQLVPEIESATKGNASSTADVGEAVADQMSGCDDGGGIRRRWTDLEDFSDPMPLPTTREAGDGRPSCRSVDVDSQRAAESTTPSEVEPAVNVAQSSVAETAGSETADGRPSTDSRRRRRCFPDVCGGGNEVIRRRRRRTVEATTISGGSAHGADRLTGYFPVVKMPSKAQATRVNP